MRRKKSGRRAWEWQLELGNLNEERSVTVHCFRAFTPRPTGSKLCQSEAGSKGGRGWARQEYSLPDSQEESMERARHNI